MQLVQMLSVLAAAWAQGWQQKSAPSTRGHARCGHLLKQKAKSAASERWMAVRLSRNNKGVCLFSTCCIPVGKIKMHVFSQVFITDLIFNGGADCGGGIVDIFFLESAVSFSQGFGKEVGQTALCLWTTCLGQ